MSQEDGAVDEVEGSREDKERLLLQYTILFRNDFMINKQRISLFLSFCEVYIVDTRVTPKVPDTLFKKS